MAKIPVAVTNERREKVWLLMLEGHSPQSIKKELNIPNLTMYREEGSKPGRLTMIRVHLRSSECHISG